MELFPKAIQRGLNAYRNREQYAYFYGAKGQVLTDATMDALINAEKAYLIYKSSRTFRGLLFVSENSSKTA